MELLERGYGVDATHSTWLREPTIGAGSGERLRPESLDIMPDCLDYRAGGLTPVEDDPIVPPWMPLVLGLAAVVLGVGLLAFDTVCPLWVILSDGTVVLACN